ncbi:Conserved hypothetical protein [Prochlorococcus marinus str. MIT 9313]|uniref:Uncharacterized protein n=1 Tax=Prochlorococcus marinus (strain MIT 9313) TaxID=74547 RepID=B9ERP6_PROMM|nr:Conserved hypothetical protein [Prochlorococcus marinus str. MIT 9313]
MAKGAKVAVGLIWGVPANNARHTSSILPPDGIV